MAGVGLVVDQHLPVAAVHVAQHAARDFQAAFRRPVHHVVQRGQRVAEEFLERLALGIQAAEHKAAMVAHVLDGGHALAGFAVFQAGVFVALFQRDRQQAAVGLEGPGVIRAAEELARVAAGLACHHGAFVRAAVVQHANRLVAVAHHHHGLVAHSRGHVVAGIRNLAVVADEDPGVGIQALHFQVEQFLVDEEVLVHLGVAQQRTDGVGIVAVFGHDGFLVGLTDPAPGARTWRARCRSG